MANDETATAMDLNHVQKNSWFTAPTLYRVLPFALFMGFIGLEEAIRLAASQMNIGTSDLTFYYLYPVKTVVVAAILLRYLRQYREFRLNDLLDRNTVTVFVVGVVTFVMWVLMDWTVSVSGNPKGFNVSLLPEGAIRSSMTLMRVAGAVLVVPLMEEIFWRSFLLRYLIDPDFERVPIGRFTWPSCLITIVLFGLEHHMVFAGMMAGAMYNLVLYTTRSLAQCVFAHAVTNLALACYVLYTGKWFFW